MRYKLFVLAVLSFSGSLLMAQNVFKGVVLNADKLPLEGVTISVASQPITITDSAGFFQFTDSSNRISISFSHVGYLSQLKNYMAGGQIIVTLSNNSNSLTAITVQAFERNTTLNNIPVSVSLLSKADLERFSNTTLIQAVNTVPGVKMDERSPGSYRLLYGAIYYALLLVCAM